ncbi:MAG TPA: hypothetical protein V6D02_14170 [Candidatus Obscuribacterales bacterium]
MNRYLLGALVGLISLLTIYGVGNSRDLVQQSREAVSANPTAASEGLTGIEGAGQNVTRQIGSDGVPVSSQSNDTFISGSDASGTTPAVEPTTRPAEPVAPATPTVQPVTPTVPPQQDAIPALW